MASPIDLEKLRAKLGVGANGPPPPPAPSKKPLTEQTQRSEKGPENTEHLSLTDLELISEEGSGHGSASETSVPPENSPRPQSGTPSQSSTQPHTHAAQSQPNAQPLVRVALESVEESRVPLSPNDTLMVEWTQEAAFFAREAEASAIRQPERAGWMNLAAAIALEHADAENTVAESTETEGAETGSIDKHLKTALNRAGDTPAIVSLVRESMLLRHRYDDVLEIAERQVDVGGDNASRNATLIEAAAIARHHRGNTELALSYLKQASKLQPGHALTLALTAGLQLETGQQTAAAATLEQLADALSAPIERAICLNEAGNLRELQGTEETRAAENYVRAIDADPQNLPALLALAELYEKVEDWPGLADTLEQLAELDFESSMRARLLIRAGIIRMSRTADLEAASRALTSAAELDPEDPAPLSRLACLYEAMGRYEALIDILHRRLALTPDAKGKAAILTRIGWLLHHRLASLDEAMDAYQDALSAFPGYGAALYALHALKYHAGDFEGLVELLHNEAEGRGSAAQRAARCIEAAELLLEKLERPDDAIVFFQRALQLDSTQSHAFGPLRRLLAASGQHGALAALLAERIEIMPDCATRTHLAIELARIQAGPLRQVERAVETLSHIRGSATDNIVDLVLADLYATNHKPSALVELLLSTSDTTTAADRDTQKDNKASSTDEVRLFEAAKLLETRLNAHDRAIDIYRRILKRNSSSTTAFNALAQLYHDLQRWKELAELLETEATRNPSGPGVAEMWCAIAHIRDDSLGQPREAIDAYKKTLELDPTSSTAMAGIERLMLAEKRFTDLVRVLIRYAKASKEPVATVDALCRAAELAEHSLDDLEQAQKLYTVALTRRAESAHALFGLSAVQRRLGDNAGFTETVSKLHAAASNQQQAGSLAFLELQRARHRELRCNESVDAAAYAVANTFSQGRLRLTLLRIGRQHNAPNLAEQLATAGLQTADDTLAAAYLLEAAQRYELDGSLTAQQEAAMHAAQRLPGEPAIEWNLRRAYQANGEWDNVSRVLKADAERIIDVPARLNRMAEAAAAALMANSPAEAVNLAQQCLSADPQHIPSLRLMAHAAAGRSDWRALAAWHDRIADTCVDDENRLVSCELASDLWAQRVGDSERALRSLRPALLADPAQRDAFSRAENLLEHQGRFEELSQLYAHRIRNTTVTMERIALHRRHTRILREQLGDAGRALHELGELLSLAPDDIDALIESTDLLGVLRRWADAADALDSLIAHKPDAAIVRDARIRLARISFEQLHDAQRARTALHRLLDRDPTDLEAKRLLVRVDLAEGEWEDAQRNLESLASSDDIQLAVWAMTKLADVAKTGFNDESLRDSWENEAITLAAGDAETFTALIGRYRERGVQQRFVAFAERLLSETTDANLIERLRLALSAVFVEDLGDPDRALEYLRDSLVADPQGTQINLLFAQALELKSNAEDAVRVYRKIIDKEPTEIRAYRGLLRLGPLLDYPATGAAAAAGLAVLGAATTAEIAKLDSLIPSGFPMEQPTLPTLAVDREQRAVVELLELIAPHIGSLYPTTLTRELTAGDPAHEACIAIGTALGITGIKVGIDPSVKTVRCGVGRLVHLHMSRSLADNAKSPAFKFWVGRALSASLTPGPLLNVVDNNELSDIVAALCNDHLVDPVLQQLKKRIFRALPRRVRKQVELITYPSLDSDTWANLRALEQFRADQAGAVFCGSVHVALQEIAHVEEHSGVSGVADSPRLCTLLRFSVSDVYARLHRSAWTVRS